MPERAVRLGVVQMKAQRRPARNLEKAVACIRHAARARAQIICLQELFRTRYFCQTEEKRFFGLAEKVPGKTTRIFMALARKLGTVLIVPLFEERSGARYHNTAVVIDADGKLLGSYRKMHIPYDPGFYEKFYFTPGDLGFRVFQTRFARIGAAICWDQWFPEVSRLLALQGAQILFYPTAIGWAIEENARIRHREKKAWQTVQIAHAIANGVFVAAVNRVGREDRLRFWGSSFVAGPQGEIIAQGAEDREETLLADCDLSQIDRVRQDWPFFRDRRVDAYGGMSRVSQ